MIFALVLFAAQLAASPQTARTLEAPLTGEYPSSLKAALAEARHRKTLARSADNRFAEAYNAWATTANAHQPGTLDVRAAAQWREVKREFKALAKTIDAEYR